MPGRLLDLQRSPRSWTSAISGGDEADRMLDLGFADDLTEVNQLTIQRKQTMMFSAIRAPHQRTGHPRDAPATACMPDSPHESMRPSRQRCGPTT
jgi:hypothetical protein